MKSKWKLLASLLMFMLCFQLSPVTAREIATPQPREDVQVDMKSGLVTNAPYIYSDYAPYLYQSYYHYEGENMEFATYDVYVTHPEDHQGKYQYVIESGAIVAHVMQVQKDQITELSYFPDEYPLDKMPDLRNHADSMDDMMFTVIPKDLTPGTVFYSDYRKEIPFEVVGILQEMTVLDTKFYDVLMVQSVESNNITRLYYAPGIGLIQSEFETEGTTIYSRLADYE